MTKCICVACCILKIALKFLLILRESLKRTGQKDNGQYWYLSDNRLKQRKAQKFCQTVNPIWHKFQWVLILSIALGEFGQMLLPDI